MASDASPIESTVRRIEFITTEISGLRDAVASHRNAGLGLDAVARTLGELATELSRLPSDMRSEFSGAANLIDNLGAAVKPAGALETVIRESMRENGEVLAAIRRDRETMDQAMSSFREELASLRGLAIEQQKELVRESGEALAAMARNREALDHAMREFREELSDFRSSVAEQLDALEQRLEASAATQSRDAESIKARLAKLTGLARRSFFALLRGKDAPPDPL